ncbi:MAG: SDR family NAD(P)-dependent oxidoreductase [Proteobacteria bacterium]|nr:SDR family NAD(P)-dependent oxidoreductase [Pseudomonadota bacterium]
MQDFSGKVAFVTGAASGIGFGIARALAGAGMKVMLADIEKPALENSAKDLRSSGATIQTIVCDVSDARSMVAAADATVAAFGKVHVLCNNAGVSTGGLVEECDDGDWDWVIGVNFLGVLNGCRAFLPHIKRHREGGHIVNTSSMAGLLGGIAGWGPYNSTKFAVVGLTEVLRQEGREGGFGASVLCPGGVNTNIYEAPRNRPGRFGPQVSKVAFMDNPDELKQGLDPRIVGELVLEAMRENRLYIFTDPRFRKLVEKRYQRILEDFDWAANSQTLNAAAAPGAKRGG